MRASRTVATLNGEETTMVGVGQTAGADLMDLVESRLPRGAAEAETGIESKYLDW
jgi:hypothetical protein